MRSLNRSQLELRRGYRERTQCAYWDIYVDGKRLAEVLDVGDRIPPFGWVAVGVEAGRMPLFVCPECAGYGCGVVTCAVEWDGDTVVWRDFGLEDDSDAPLHQRDADRLMRFVFDAIEYRAALGRVLPAEKERHLGRTL